LSAHHLQVQIGLQATFATFVTHHHTAQVEVHTRKSEKRSLNISHFVLYHCQLTAQFEIVAQAHHIIPDNTGQILDGHTDIINIHQIMVGIKTDTILVKMFVVEYLKSKGHTPFTSLYNSRIFISVSLNNFSQFLFLKRPKGIAAEGT
jgi:hypothetical protein